MAGHSHAKNVQHRKERVNAKKAKAFSKVAKMITVAAKLGGGDPNANPRLRLAIDKARMVSMPKDNVERAIKKGTGDGDVGDFEELTYEGYGPAGVAVMLEILTDNRNRTAPEIRKLFERRGGNLASNGAVAWMFERKAVVRVPGGDGVNEERLMELAIESGAEDLVGDGDGFEIRCEPSALGGVQDALAAGGIAVDGGEVTYLPTQTAAVDSAEQARKVLDLLDALDDHDDVQAVHANFVLSDEVVAELDGDAS